MPSKGRKHCRNLPPDFLSNLPDNIIDVILMCLPSKDAVRTSILSKKWRYHWCRLTKLMLDESHWRTEEDFQDLAIKFTKIIYPFVTLHEGPISKFTLDVANLESFPEIDNFIYFLSKRGIQHLVLHLPYDSECKLPSSLFMCSQLRHLSLHHCLIHPPSVFKGFDWLTSLELCDVTISSILLGSLISHCPLLEKLVLSTYTADPVEISAPMLRSFEFRGDISSICLKNVPLLVEVSLVCFDEAKDLDFAKVFESCSALEHLFLDLSNIYGGFFADEGYEGTTRLPFALNSVKQCYLFDLWLEDSYILSHALSLIRSFPYLEYLKIEVYNDGDIPTEESLTLKHLSDVTFNHLRKVKLQCFTGRTYELQLIKLLLANSPVLLRMIIHREYPDREPPETRLKIVAELLPALEHLYLERGTVQFLVNGAAEVPTRLSSPLSHLKRFNISLHGLAEFSFAFCLVQGSPYIQDIEMEVYHLVYALSGEPEASNEVDEVLARFSDVTLNHLMTVQLGGAVGIKFELQLIKLLLTKSPMLVRMLIEPSTVGDYDGRRDKVLAELTAIQCASRKAEVVVFDAYECYSDD